MSGPKQQFYTGNPNITRQGARGRVAARSNTELDRLSVMLNGLLGGAPDEHGSVLDPQYGATRPLAEGAFAVGTALGVAPLVQGALGLAGRAASALRGPVAGGRRAQEGVIKLPGGNWEGVERALRGLLDEDVDSPQGQAWVLKNLGNYVKRDLGTERDPVRKMLRERPEVRTGAEDMHTGSLSRKRAAEGFPPQGAEGAPSGANNYELTEPQAWESAADYVADPTSVRAYVSREYGGEIENARLGTSIDKPVGRAADERSYYGPEMDAEIGAFGPPKPDVFLGGRGVLNQEHEWMARVDPRTKLHTFNAQDADRLGMNHLLDELNQAVAYHTPPDAAGAVYWGAEDLAKAARWRELGLTIDPDKLARMSVPDAYAHVHRINEWRAAQKAEADLARANSGASHVLKEYPEQNLRWVELRKPDQLPEGWKVDADGNGIGPDGNYAQDPRVKDLEDALGYEGETMGHCVGGAGHCPDVVAGRARIFSLRDADGRPHLTVEAKPGKPWNEQGGWFTARPELETVWREFYNKGPGHRGTAQQIKAFPEWLQQKYPETWAKHADAFGEPPLNITEMKGRFNRGAPEYRAQLLDLLNGGVPGLPGKWGAVNDVDLQELYQTGGRFWDYEGLADAAKKYGRIGDTNWEQARARMSEAGFDEQRALGNWLDAFTRRNPLPGERLGELDLPPEGYAAGGSVQSPLAARPDPTDAQKRAGNYLKGHHVVHGMRVSVEHDPGMTRRGKDRDGSAWEQELQHAYGYIRGTQGRDKDHIDVFLGPEADNPEHAAYVVDQLDPDGNFDEHKVMLGFPDEDSAVAAYHENYEPGWRGFGDVTALPLEAFKAWAFAPGRRIKPVSRLAQYRAAPEREGYAGGGAVTGFFPHMNARRQRQDPQAAKDAPWSAARGWAAGTLGLPGDLESLVRLLPGLDSHAKLPTSEFYNEWLPGRAEGASNRLFEGLGNLTGGAGSPAAARPVAKALQATPGALSKVAESMAAARPAYVPRAQEGAVKLKGGNWSATPGLGVDLPLAQLAPGEGPVGAWAKKQLRGYITKQMGTAEDPLLALEREGRLHLDPNDLLERVGANGGYDEVRGPQYPPNQTVFNGDPFHEAQTGRTYRTPWEAYSDSHISGHDPQYEREGLAIGARQSVGTPSIAELIARVRPEEAAALERSRWLDSAAPDTKIWGFAPLDDSVAGFDHVLDYLRAASNAGRSADLPVGTLRGLGRHEEADFIARGLHLTPEQLSRTSVPDAVAKTAEWNKMLAEAQRLQDMNKGVKQVLKAYPDTGHQWVELAPEGLKAEGAAMRHCVGGYCSEVEDGSTRILSLRTKDGQPAVTVELRPVSVGPDGHRYSWRLKDDIAEQMGARQTHDVVQIKGPANRKPNAEALAAVQDLVKGGVPGLEKWGRVGDLRNTDLVPHNGGYAHPINDPIYDFAPGAGGTFPPMGVGPRVFEHAGFDFSQPFSARQLHEFMGQNFDALHQANLADLQRHGALGPEEAAQTRAVFEDIYKRGPDGWRSREGHDYD